MIRSWRGLFGTKRKNRVLTAKDAPSTAQQSRQMQKRFPAFYDAGEPTADNSTAVAEARGESARAPSNDYDEDDTAANEGQAHEAWRGDAVDIADQQLISLNGYGAIEE